ncbi:MAG: Zn-dependent hydrolase, partial [Pseudomonadota bacterium]
MSTDTRISDAVSQTRLWDRHVVMGSIGATARGGVNRLALSAADAAAQAELAGWAATRGFRC